MKKILLSPWIALLTLLIMLSIRVSDGSFLESIRLRYFDQLITSKPTTVSQQVHVVNIDDETIRQKGQFPFPRGEYASLIDSLYRNGAGLVVFNVFMPDADRFKQDSVLANTLKKHPVVLPHTATNDSSVLNRYPPFRPGVSVIGSGDPGIKYNNIQPNVEVINETATGIGIVNTLPEIDGVVRRVPMVASIDSKLYPSITLETLRVAAGDPSFQVKTNDGSIEAVRIPQFGKIPTDSYGRIWVDWSSRPTEHSASNLPKNFENGIVIVGLTARGLNNPVATSTGEVFPHYLQASVLSTVVGGINISRPDWADGVEIILIAISGIILLVLTRWVYFGLGSTVLLIASGIAGSYYFFSTNLWLLDPTAYVATLVLVALHAYGIKFVSEFLQKMQIKKQFGGYLSPVIVNQLAEDPEAAAERLKGETRELSIVMTDLRGFTTLGESFGADVQGLTAVMNRYMDALSKPVLKNGGCIIKYIGDASLHVHNAPLDDKQHAVTAVKTALEMIQAIEEFNKELQAEGRPPVGMGAGVNTGPTLIGNIGANERYGYDVLGDSVSTAARLEGQTKGYGVLLIIGPETNRLIQDEYATLELDCIAVKGKTVGLNIYAVVGRHEELLKTTAYVPETKAHEKMLELYRIQKFDMAIKLCNELKGTAFKGYMDDYYEIWIERCEEMKTKNLPADWDGIYRATSK
jgi:adenylate cyclase